MQRVSKLILKIFIYKPINYLTWKDIMAAIDFMMTYVKRSGADPKQKLVDFATMWQLEPKLLASLKISAIQDVQIQNIVSLYPI